MVYYDFVLLVATLGQKKDAAITEEFKSKEENCHL